MFERLFNRNKTGKKTSKIGHITTEPRKLAFEMLIIYYLEKYGIDEDGYRPSGPKAKNEEEEKWIKQTLEVSGFIDNIEDIIISEWQENRKLNSTLKPKDFVNIFISCFHNMKIESVAPEFVRERNKNLLQAYRNIIKIIERIQGWLEDEKLRTRIESDFRKKTDIQSTIFQCTTPFCIISLGCDQMGRYNLVYSVDYRFQEMISENFASIFIRRIYEFTPGEMEPFVRIGSLFTDCIDTFSKVIEETKIEPFHKITIQEKHKND